MEFLLAWLILALGVFAAAKLIPGVQVPDFWDAVVVAAIFGVLNFFLGWLLYVFLGLATLGIGFLLGFITRLIVNAILLKFTDALTDRMTIKGFGNAVLASLVISAVGILADVLID
jgi:putative membrane protein